MKVYKARYNDPNCKFVNPKYDISEFKDYDREDLIIRIKELEMQCNFAINIAEYNQTYQKNQRKKGSIAKRKYYLKAFEHLINTYNRDVLIDDELKPGEHAKEVLKLFKDDPQKYGLEINRIPTEKTLIGWINKFAKVPLEIKSKPGRPKISR